MSQNKGFAVMSKECGSTLQSAGAIMSKKVMSLLFVLIHWDLSLYKLNGLNKQES
jgi:hypothetical protein